MSVKALLIVAITVAAAAAWPSVGHAEKVKSNQETKVYSRAGEQSAVIVTIKSGQAMTLLARDGRWLKVRVSGRTGWIPRSKVDIEDEEISRNTRRRPFVDGRGTKRGFGGEAGPDDRIGADAIGEGLDPEPAKPSRGKPAKKAPAADDEDEDTGEDGDDVLVVEEDESDGGGGGDDEGGSDAERKSVKLTKRLALLEEADEKSAKVVNVGPTTQLYYIETKGKFTLVENDEGDVGYVLTSNVEKEDDDAPVGARVRRIDARARLGFTLISQSVSTAGGTATPPDNYTASSSSVSLALGGSVLYPYKKRLWVGGEMTYDLSRAVFGGISYMNSTSAFTLHDFNLRALAGYDLQNKRGMVVFGRLGYHYEAFRIANVEDPAKNTAKIPNQNIGAPTLGVGLTIPLLTKKIGVDAHLDTILIGGSLSQTVGLEDGTDPSAKAVFFGGQVTYRWKPKMDLQAVYDLAYVSKSFGGGPPATSTRGHTGMGIPSGSDLNHSISFGVTRAF